MIVQVGHSDYIQNTGVEENNVHVRNTLALENIANVLYTNIVLSIVVTQNTTFEWDIIDVQYIGVPFATDNKGNSTSTKKLAKKLQDSLKQ